RKSSREVDSPLVGLAVLAAVGAEHPRAVAGVQIPVIVVAALLAARHMDNLAPAVRTATPCATWSEHVTARTRSPSGDGIDTSLPSCNCHTLAGPRTRHRRSLGHETVP